MKRKQNKGDGMDAIARRIIETPAANFQEMAKRIRLEAPTLKDLNNEQLEQVARLVITQRIAAEMNRAVELDGIDWQEKKEAFLSEARSVHTRRAYSASLSRLEAWAAKMNKNPLELNAWQADQFIRELRAEGKAAATTRRDIAALSAFYTWLERYHDAIKNPIRGTKSRPARENKKEIIIPTPDDYKIIIAELPEIERAIVIAMASRGLRAGALPGLELRGEKYHGKSKGKILMENDTAGITLPPEALKAIRAAGLDVKKPFSWTTKQGTPNSANAIEGRINFHIDKLFKDKRIGAPYSCHDFRHFYAVNEYKKNKDLYRLSKLLNHAGIQITQTYLRSLGVEL